MLSYRPFIAATVLFAITAARCDSADRPTAPGQPREWLVYFGTYTGGASKGIYLSRLDSATGALSTPELAAELASPSFLAIHAGRRLLCAVNEVNEVDGKKGGAVSLFSIAAETGALSFVNRQTSGGGGPCHLVIDRAGKNVLAANYGGGSVTVVPVGDDGRLAAPTAFIQHRGSSVNASRQEAPHAHSINLDPANKFAVAADLGLDKILVYRFDAERGLLTPNTPPAASVAPGSGPRHFAFHPTGRFAYVINEMTLTVTAFQYDAERGELKEVQTISTLPPGTVNQGYSTAEVQVHPSGKFLYGSNRGHDTLAIFAIDEATGRLTPVGHQPTGGKTPRNFGIDPTGRFLLAANQDSDTVVAFRVDLQSGRLTPTGAKIEVPKPVCVKMLAAP